MSLRLSCCFRLDYPTLPVYQLFTESEPLWVCNDAVKASGDIAPLALFLLTAGPAPHRCGQEFCKTGLNALVARDEVGMGEIGIG